MQLLADVVSAFTVLSNATASSAQTIYPINYAVSVTLLMQLHN